MSIVRQPLICPRLIARDSYLESVEQLLHDARSGTGACLLISGEAGIGKSRLLQAIAKRANESGWHVLSGSLVEASLSYPHAVIADLIRRLITDVPQAAQEIPASSMRQLVPLVPEIDELLPNLKNDIRQTEGQEQEQEQQRLLTSAITIVAHLATKRPLLITIEDVHWSDEASLEFLHQLARRVRAFPALLILTYRDDEVGPSLEHFLAVADRERLAVELKLERLGLADVDLMIRACLSLSRSVRADFLQSVYQLTNGNPFFIEEVLGTAMADAGQINRPEMLTLERLRVPRSVRESVQRRIADLSQPATELLRVAATIGIRFDLQLLQMVGGWDETQLLSLIRELVAQQLVLEEAEDRFAFRHALTCEAVRAGMLGRERQQIHARVVTAIERLPATADEYVEELALHTYAAHQWAKAVEFLQSAGMRALRLHAPATAAQDFTRAIEVTQRLSRPPSAELYLHRAEARQALGEFEDARLDYETAISFSEDTVDNDTLCRALLGVGLLWAARDYSRSRSPYERAVHIAREIGDKALLAHALNRLGNWYSNMGEYAEARRSCDEALAIFRDRGDRQGVAQTLDLLGMTCLQAGRLSDSFRYYKEALAIIENLDDKHMLVSILASIPFLSGTYQSDMVPPALSLREAGDFGERAVALSREMGDPSALSYALWQLGFCLGPQGYYERALHLTTEALTIAQEIGHTQWALAARCMLGALHTDVLQPEKAISHLEEALRLARTLNSVTWVAQSTVLLVDALLLQRRVGEAASLLTEVEVSANTSTSESIMQAWHATALVKLAVARGDAHNALTSTVLSTAELRTGRLERLRALVHNQATSWGIMRWSSSGHSK